MQSLKISCGQLHGQTPISGEVSFSTHREGNFEEYMTNVYNIDLDKYRCVQGYPTIYMCWPKPESSNLLNLNHQVAEVMEKSTKKIIHAYFL